jgi:hypothetical protein
MASMDLGGTITSPWEFSFGVNGEVFTGTVTFNDGTRALQTIKMDRSAGLTRFASLVINGIVVGTPTQGGTVTIAAPALAGFGLNVFEDIHSIGLV